MPTVVDRGLEGVVVGSTELSNVEGAIGRLTYRGYDIDDLAPNATFEEIVHLLLYGALPNRHQLETLKREIGAGRSLPEPLVNAMQNFPKTAWPMEVLRTIVSGLGLFSPVNAQGEHLSDVHTAIELIAKMPTIVAAWDRIRRGLDPIDPRPDLSQAGNFIYMRTGEAAARDRGGRARYVLRASGRSLVQRVDLRRASRGLDAGRHLRFDYRGAGNAARRSARRCRQRPAFATFGQVKSPENAEPYVRNILDSGKRIMGMGHREYKVRDPRARHLEEMAQELSVHVGGGDRWYEIARAVEDASRKVLQEKKPGNTIYANVDFYTAPVLADLGIPGDEFTCLFACGRIAGWTAHVLEQMADNRLIRPQAAYDGPPAGPYVPIEQRSANGQRG